MESHTRNRGMVNEVISRIHLHHAVAVFRKADSKTWTVRCFRRNDFLAWVLKKEETIDMPDAQSDKELWLRAEIWVQDVLDELEASGEAAM